MSLFQQILASWTFFNSCMQRWVKHVLPFPRFVSCCLFQGFGQPFPKLWAAQAWPFSKGFGHAFSKAFAASFSKE